LAFLVCFVFSDNYLQPVTPMRVPQVYLASLERVVLSGPLLVCETISTAVALTPPLEADGAIDLRFAIVILLIHRVPDDVAELTALVREAEEKWPVAVLVVGVGSWSDFSRLISLPQFCVAAELDRALKRIPETIVRHFKSRNIDPGLTDDARRADVDAAVFSSLRETGKRRQELDNLRTTWKI
jgi:hypothetical protein